MTGKADTCVLVSAGAEWRALLPHFPGARVQPTPFGDAFTSDIHGISVIFLHGGWGKVAAAASTQYAVDQWHPDRIVNLGTCGGFSGRIERGDLILAGRTVIYDIIEQMTDYDQAIEKYAVDFDLSWLPEVPPQPVITSTLLSADRDILPSDIPGLIRKYEASAADWESGSIAWVAKKNNIPCLILRGVSDLVSPMSAEAYGNYALFEQSCRGIMEGFANHLPAWLEVFQV